MFAAIRFSSGMHYLTALSHQRTRQQVSLTAGWDRTHTCNAVQLQVRCRHVQADQGSLPRLQADPLVALQGLDGQGRGVSVCRWTVVWLHEQHNNFVTLDAACERIVNNASDAAPIQIVGSCRTGVSESATRDVTSDEFHSCLCCGVAQPPCAAGRCQESHCAQLANQNTRSSCTTARARRGTAPALGGGGMCGLLQGSLAEKVTIKQRSSDNHSCLDSCTVITWPGAHTHVSHLDLARVVVKHKGHRQAARRRGVAKQQVCNAGSALQEPCRVCSSHIVKSAPRCDGVRGATEWHTSWALRPLQ